ncbi:sigma factor-like helix-turn-helix DNA-binding protein [Nocardioides sp. YIM 152315]|uniref:sigma factor-like helix-turn-helix DNA-binding protein n=1 Tax=Nocardioides sp. YIM 152315 TaxID=3031760 RepID=UPI0023DBA07D|nr:sigma factor-like helix-turn-helix DNA-binding protein [Nocardioides sp. YIM 152315]MDF1605500.1 sigma factor-like helix-turn-helix DNA-binding protein [Nocardioides sp. YIM 152315]
MPADDADFAAYLTARWPAVVRTLVLLGTSRSDAESTGREALAGCYGSWQRVRHEDDVDAHVYRAVLSSWRRGRRQRIEPNEPTEATEANDPADPVPLRRALRAELDRLPVEEREVLVLRFVAELDDVQVADALDVPLEVARDRLADGLARLDLDALQELGP